MCRNQNAVFIIFYFHSKLFVAWLFLFWSNGCQRLKIASKLCAVVFKFVTAPTDRNSGAIALKRFLSAVTRQHCG